MLDRDDRATAAHLLRCLAPTNERACELADALEAEPEGYDYETAAAERGKALADLLTALRPITEGKPMWQPLSEAFTRAEEVMEGIEPSPVVRERDEARAALVEMTRRRGDAMDALEALPEGAADWTVGYDAGRAQERKENGAALTEAREALRELLATIDGGAVPTATADMRAASLSHARAQARAVLEGVERTRAPVPLKSLAMIEDCLEDYVGDQLSDGASGRRVTQTLDVLNAVRAAARGERVEWPS